MRLFIPNRGEIACRIIDCCNTLGITPILGYSLADIDSRARRICAESICIGAGEARDSYLNIDAIIAYAKEAKADAVHPGYGFLAENAEFAAAVSRAKLVFVGPTAAAMKKLGDKIAAKKIARKCSVPILESITLDEADHGSKLQRKLSSFAKTAAFPLLVKSAAGGGGRGMRIVQNSSELMEQATAAAREAKNIFGDGTIFIEPYITGARHIEVQVIGDRAGTVRALGTRDCSLQRRHQKVIEEAPASFLSPDLEKALLRAAEKICKHAGYESLATVEFLIADRKRFYFLEVNTRLQVEHPISEESLGIDLVMLQIQVARGKKLESLLPAKLRKPRFSIEARICAEYPEADFRAATGQITHLHYPESENLRVDFGYERGDRVTHHYDSLLAKVIATGDSRAGALKLLNDALSNLLIAPLRTNTGYLHALINYKSFQQNTHTLQTAGEVLKNYILTFHKRRQQVIALAQREEFWLHGEYYDKSKVSLNADAGGEILLSNKFMTIVALDGDTFALQNLPAPVKPRLADGSAKNSADILAHLPGKVSAVQVQKGKKVSQGDPLLVLESMKMEHTITAPQSGNIAEVFCRAGQMVMSGELLLRISKK